MDSEQTDLEEDQFSGEEEWDYDYIPKRLKVNEVNTCYRILCRKGGVVC